MLAKLLKYEFKATGRMFLPFYLALIGFALINRLVSFDLISRLEPSILTSQLGVIAWLVKVVYSVLMVVVIVITLLSMVQRFYKSLLGDEGYLMFTLPVKTWQHITSKLIVAAVWSTASVLVTFGSIMILSAKAGFWELLGETLASIKGIFGVAGFFTFPLAALATLLTGILMIYAAITLGHLSTKYRLFTSFAWYYALHFVSSVLLTAIIIPLVGYFEEVSVYEVFPADLFQKMVLWLSLLSALVLGTAYFMLINFIFNHKLNLE